MVVWLNFRELFFAVMGKTAKVMHKRHNKPPLYSHEQNWAVIRGAKP